MFRSKFFVTLWVILGMLVLVSALKWKAALSVPAPRPALVGRVTGDPKAPVKIVGFTDFQCPACSQAAEVIHAFFTNEHASNGRAFLELRYFPLESHRHARRAAIVAQCALEQGKFWPMHNVLFRSQKSWEGMDDPDVYFLSLARGLGMDDVALMKCMAQPLARAVLDQDIDQGKRMGVKATPTFFINGKMVVGVLELQKALKELL